MSDSTSLDHLHDLALPPEVPWWPLAPGGYAVISLALIAVAWLACREWKRWQSNAYRRAALRELQSLDTPVAIAELLRRTALAIAPRAVIADLTGIVWLDWLAKQCPEPIPETVRTQLTTGIYQPSGRNENLGPLHAYAALWISSHHSPPC